MNLWYLIQYKPNSHKTAECNLNRQGFKTFLPLIEVTSRSKAKFRNKVKPLFPGYMFVGIDLNTQPWQKINNTVGVLRLVCYEGRPKALHDELVIGLLSRCDHFGVLISSKKLVIGDSIKIVKGAFADFVATIETVDSNKRIWVMMELMGRPTRIQIPSENINLS